MSLKLGTCPRCGTVILMGEVNGCRTAVDVMPVDAAGALSAVMGGRMIYRQHLTSRGAVSHLDVILGAPELDWTVMADHPCGSTLVYRPLTAPVAPDPRPAAVRPPSGNEAPPSGPVSTAAPAEPAEPATPRRFRRHSDSHRPNVPCSVCGKELGEPGTYAMFELGATVIDAFHVGSPCGSPPSDVDC